MTSVYVAVWNGRPIAAGADLDSVKAAAVARESQYLSKPPEYRWDAHPGGDYWDLMQLNRVTGRWNRTSTLISAVPIVDAPAASEECPR